jgi:hypothetical protein
MTCARAQVTHEREELKQSSCAYAQVVMRKEHFEVVRQVGNDHEPEESYITACDIGMNNLGKRTRFGLLHHSSCCLHVGKCCYRK